ncbi:MAG: aminoacyl-tRNA hydrolase [Gammaproteobacteria bacterium]|nr:aminoacyl-tRNA hydrolase [Gammaproteobacteria bacterium]
MKIPVTGSLFLDDGEMECRFIRAAGPGGQNVNKVATAVQLRFDPAALPEDIRARVLRLAGRRATREGMIVIEAKRYRTQERNREDALDRLVRLVRRAAQPPKPRKKTRVSRAAKKKRVATKRRRGAKKQLRKPPADE